MFYNHLFMFFAHLHSDASVTPSSNLLGLEYIFICIKCKSIPMQTVANEIFWTPTPTPTQNPILYLLFRCEDFALPNLFHISRQNGGQRLCVSLACRPKFLTGQFAVFSFWWVETIDSCRLIRVPVCCSVKAAWLFAPRVSEGISSTTTDEH